MSKHIISLIPAHRTYVEPFAGAAWVFWKKDPSAVEVLNDVDPDLIRFYRNIGSIKKCDVKAISGQWRRLRDNHGSLKPCEFVAVVVCSFGDKRLHDSSTSKKVCTRGAPRFHDYLPVYQTRLKNTKLHNDDWEKVVRKYDARDTFIYLDPPYHSTLRDYQHGGDQLDRLAKVLPKLKSKWLLTYDAHLDVKAAFRNYNIVQTSSNYTISRGDNAVEGQQYIITNYIMVKPCTSGPDQCRVVLSHKKFK